MPKQYRGVIELTDWAWTQPKDQFMKYAEIEINQVKKEFLELISKDYDERNEGVNA